MNAVVLKVLSNCLPSCVQVAVKVIDKKKARQDSYVLKNMKREPRIHQMVRHPHIVVLLEVKEQTTPTVNKCVNVNVPCKSCVSDLGDGEQLLHGHGAVCGRRPDGQDL